jgi:hypothetical protein
MITIHIDSEIMDGETQSFEFVVGGKRRITLDFNEKNLSLNIPGKVDPKSMSNSGSSFFLRTENS